MQWAICFVENPEVFVEQLKSILNPGAVIFLKENFTIPDNNKNNIPKYGQIRERATTLGYFSSFTKIMEKDMDQIWDGVLFAIFRLDA
jgi:hypothetical protein